MHNELAFENCLTPLLTALEWRGSGSSLKEAMPHAQSITSASLFCTVLENLNYEVTMLSLDNLGIDKRLLPILITTTEDVWVLLGIENEQYRIFKGNTNEESILSRTDFAQKAIKRPIYFFKLKESIRTQNIGRGWFWITLQQNKILVNSAVFLTFVLSFLMLATPLFVMSVYDLIIATSSYTMLIEFGLGVLLAIIGIYAIYRIRSEHLALLGAHFGKAIGNQIMSQLLYLAPIYTETATTGAQVARLRDFDKVREFVSGPMLSTFFDLPFIVIALLIIAILGKLLIFVPLAMILVFVGVTFVLTSKVNYLVSQSAIHFSDLQEFLLEGISALRVIKSTASVNNWSERYREKSATTNLIMVRLTVYDGISAALSEAIMMMSGMLIITWGALSVMDDKLNIGMLLAVMIIVWRVLAPIKTLVSVLPRLLQLTNSIRQIDRLMALRPETLQMQRVKKGKIQFQGSIAFIRVSMRYPAAYNPSLLGLSFEIPQGGFVAIIGRNGSGKSTLLKVILGLYQPQAGAILIDGQNIGQLNPLDLRRSIAYLPQIPELFYGTIEDNLRLGDPTVSEESIFKATKEAGIYDLIMAMPEGFSTRLNDQSTQKLSASFSQCLCLARAYLRDTSILLLDEPGNSLDKEADDLLMKNLQALHGKKTILMVTHRPSHIRQADKVFLMDQGQLVLQASPEEALQKIPINLL